MQSLNQSFQHLFYRNLGKINPKDVAKFERLTALRHQLTEEKRLTKSGSSANINYALDNLDTQINELLYQHRKKILQFHRVYITSRRTALQQNKFFQIPVKNILKYLSSIFQYKRAQLIRLMTLR